MEDSEGVVSERLGLEVGVFGVSGTASSSRREDFRRGLEEEDVKLDLDLRLERVDSLSSSSRLLDFDISEPTRERPELDRPKLNMMTGEMGLRSCRTLDYHCLFTLQLGPLR